MNLNRVFILGRLTGDPQLRSTTGGQQVATFGVATNRTWTNKAGAKQEAAEFHNIVVWGRQAEIAAKFLTKGSTVFVEGRLQTRTWDDKQGQRRRVTEIITERFQLGPRAANAGGGGTFAAADRPTLDAPAADEIPVINVDEESKADETPF